MPDPEACKLADLLSLQVVHLRHHQGPVGGEEGHVGPRPLHSYKLAALQLMRAKGKPHWSVWRFVRDRD